MQLKYDDLNIQENLLDGNKNSEVFKIYIQGKVNDPEYRNSEEL